MLTDPLRSPIDDVLGLTPARNPNEPLLTEIERRSPLWDKIKKHLQQRIEQHRQKNDGEMDSAKTARLRGRIAEAKYLMSLDLPPAKVAVYDDDKE